MPATSTLAMLTCVAQELSSPELIERIECAAQVAGLYKNKGSYLRATVTTAEPVIEVYERLFNQTKAMDFDVKLIKAYRATTMGRFADIDTVFVVLDGDLEAAEVVLDEGRTMRVSPRIGQVIPVPACTSYAFRVRSGESTAPLFLLAVSSPRVPDAQHL